MRHIKGKNVKKKILETIIKKKKVSTIFKMPEFYFYQFFLIFVVVAICAEARNFVMQNVANNFIKKPSHSYTKNSCASMSLKNLVCHKNMGIKGKRQKRKKKQKT